MHLIMSDTLQKIQPCLNVKGHWWQRDIITVTTHNIMPFNKIPGNENTLKQEWQTTDSTEPNNPYNSL